MRLILQYALFILVATSSIARSESRSTKEDHAVVNLKILLVAFHNGFSRYPENWEEAVAKLDLPERMIPSMERDISFSSRYRLVNLEGVTIENKIRKIIAMPGDPGKEGLREKAFDPDEVIGRKLIVEEDTGELRIYRLSERSLEKAFTAAGLKLKDFTWAPSQTAPIPARKTNRDIQHSGPDIHRAPQKAEGIQAAHQEGASEKPKSVDRLPFGKGVAWYVLGAVILGYLAFRSVRAIRKR